MQRKKPNPEKKNHLTVSDEPVQPSGSGVRDKKVNPSGEPTQPQSSQQNLQKHPPPLSQQHLPQQPQHLPKQPQHLPKQPQHLPKQPQHLPKQPQHLPQQPQHQPQPPQRLPQYSPQRHPQRHTQRHPQNHPQNHPQHHSQHHPQHHSQHHPQNHPQHHPQHHPQNHPQHHPQNQPQHHPQPLPRQLPQQLRQKSPQKCQQRQPQQCPRQQLQQQPQQCPQQHPQHHTPTMATYYYPHQQQVQIPQWNAMTSAPPGPTPIYAVPCQPGCLPVMVAPIYQFPCTALGPQSITPHGPHPPVVTEIPQITYATYVQPPVYIQQGNETTSQANESYYEEQTTTEDEKSYVDQVQQLETEAPENVTHSLSEVNTHVNTDASAQEVNQISEDPIQIYLSLAKDTLSSPRMSAIDPNDIIDELCKLNNLDKHTMWLLDLEYGYLRTLKEHNIPLYNAITNCIECKCSKHSIHPEFDSCNEKFKQILLLYYNNLVSNAYSGLVEFNGNTSIVYFQFWLFHAMQQLGMCWL